MNHHDANWQNLRRQLRGSVDWSQGQRGAYATDASVYQQFPQAVAFPADDQDLKTIVGFCRDHQIPIVGRGGGTSLSGQAIGAGLVVDFSRHMNRVLDVDTVNGRATVETGVVLDELNAILATDGWLFPPDPATASRATIGGMIGNNACGTRSIIFGRTCDSIESLECVDAAGGPLVTEWLSPEQWQAKCSGSDRDSWLYRGVTEIVDRNRQAISQRIPDLPRIAAGYSLRRLIENGNVKSLSDLIVGSEGTLALVGRATLRLKRLPTSTTLVLSSFSSIDNALISLPAVLRHQPSAVELLDEMLLTEAAQNASTRDLARAIVTPPIPQAMLLVEFFGDSETEALHRANEYMRAAGEFPETAHRVLTSAAEQKKAWEVRRLGLGLISNIPGLAKSIALIEDACIPIDRLPEYNQFVFEKGASLGLEISTYAHASVGVLHYKVMLDLHQAADRRTMRTMAEACFEKCLEVGGVFSGEHGDGIVRGEFLRRQFGDEVYQAFVDVKRLFDPAGLLNPHRKIDAPPLDRLLRYGDDDQQRRRYLEATAQPTSFFRYGEQGNIVGAIEQCNGVGACRQNLKGTMCPSYRATRDERDSTRGRANLLRLAISGQLNPPGLANPELHAALDLCLACKACKSECPNAVDMARLKSEALQNRWQNDGVSRQARTIGNMPQRMAQLAKLGWAARTVGKTWLARKLADAWAGLDHRRQPPLPAAESFDRWWKDFSAKQSTQGTPVALFVDAWHRFLEPHIARATVELLASCGYHVEVLEPFDALRTRLSMGLLEEARHRAAKLFAQLRPIAQRGTPIICIEPSEASALCDDLPDLVADIELGRQVGGSVRLLDDFLAEELARGQFSLEKASAHDQRAVVIHPHCHQRALFRAAATAELLHSAGYPTTLSDWGCCGMAGSFGYTHYDVSRQIAELKFLPALCRLPESRHIVVGTGTSCRQQALDLGDRRLVHWVELVRGRSSDQVVADA